MYQDNQKMVADKKAKGLKLSFIDKRILKAKNPANMDKETWVLKEVLVYQPDDLIEKLGTDINKYLPYYQANEEYLLSTDNAYMYVVDKDAQSLGTSNRKIESLSKWISLLSDAKEAEKAQRLLARYTHEKFQTSAKWQQWFDKNRENLYFSEVDNYKFEIAVDQ